MEIFRAAILGILQGLGEFLPISSSAHLALTPWLFNWPDPGLGFDVALHMGTLVAVIVYFWRDVVNLVRGAWHSLLPSTRNWDDIYQRLPWLVVLASIPGAVIGKLLEQQAETSFRSPLLIAINLAVFGAIILAVDRYGKKEKNLSKFTWKSALSIGFAQAAAIVPGVSRSGATMAAAVGMGFRREDAARFSFLMSIPIIFGAGVFKLPHFHDGVSTPALLVGFFVSMVTGFFTIRFLLRYLSVNSFKPFAWYRFALAAVVIGIYLVRM